MKKINFLTAHKLPFTIISIVTEIVAKSVEKREERRKASYGNFALFLKEFISFL